MTLGRERTELFMSICHQYRTLSVKPPLYPWNTIPAGISGVIEFFHRSEKVWEEAHQHITTATEKHKEYADRRRSQAPTFQPRERVWLSTHDQYFGSYKIIKQTNPVPYRIQLPCHMCINPTVPFHLLKKYFTGLLDEQESASPPESLIIKETLAHVVNKILKSHRRAGKLEYLVDWEGYQRNQVG